MPLNHVGGVVRNLFAPVFSGGSTILCPAFDSNLFWDILEEGHGTWYYASPSMHMSILAEGALRPETISRCRLRLVCNAAGGLLPALAIQLRDTFRCTVLPSYGMTECMPISTPPLHYTLDRSGTSGIGCGPEIAILDPSDTPLSPGQIGRINVRGGPTFGGYLKDGVIDKSAFNRSGWFDTGDLGSLDEEGYLYLTGRGKEVINRGGELISPFEVEEAVTIAFRDPKSTLFQRVEQVMAFSAPHDLLQEVVGVALVTPPGCPRPDIRDLHAALKPSLPSSTLPAAVVYIDALPTSNNKIVRIKFAERLDLEPITGETTLAEKHFEALCPPVNSLLSAKIFKKSCVTDSMLILRLVEECLGDNTEAHIVISHHDGTPEIFLAPTNQDADPTFSKTDIETLRTKLRQSIDGFMFPSRFTYLDIPFQRTSTGLVDEEALHASLKKPKASDSTSTLSGIEHHVCRAFSEVLGFDMDDILPTSDFFELGGDSLSAGRLLSILRRDMQVRIPIDQLFTSPRVCDLCDLVETLVQSEAKALGEETQPLPGCLETYSSTNPLVLIINLLPIMLFHPLKMAFKWITLMYSLSLISDYWSEPNTPSRFVALLASMFISNTSTQIVAPLFGIGFKWLVIGKYREGMYPMWGPYHTRWWIVQKVLLICGKVST
jgi:acyl carrier protein